MVASPRDTIEIPAGTYTLTLLLDLTIDKSLSLEGAGSGDTIIQAAAGEGIADFRVLKITGDSRPNVAISNVTIRHGGGRDGGGISNSGGTLTISGSTISGNSVGNDGGGIWNRDGTVTITGNTVSGNTAFISGGGIYNHRGDVSLASSTLGGNTATRGSGGGIYNSSGTLIITSSTLEGNTADGSGGGILNLEAALTITRSTLGGNTATRGSGGGIHNFPGILTLINATLSGNSADRDGGGILNRDSSLTITRSTLGGNTATTGNGGGIWNSVNGTMDLANTTVSGNSASGDGGGIWNIRGTVDLSNTTVSGNSVHAVGGGVWNGDDSTVAMVNTIVAGNAAGIRPECRGVLTSLGHNLVGDATGCQFMEATGDLVGEGANPIDPLLGPLQDYGGPTFTHALLSESPAIDAGDDASCPATDQRSIPRPQGAHCDIGAFEFTGGNIPPIAFDQEVVAVAGTPVAILLEGSDPNTGDTLTFIIVSLPARGNLFHGATATGERIITGDAAITGDTVTYMPTAGFTGADAFTFKVNDGGLDSNVATVNITVARPGVTGTVSLEGMPDPTDGARLTFSSGDQTIARVFSDPGNGSFEIELTPGIYDVIVEKDGFLPATKLGKL